MSYETKKWIGEGLKPNSVNCNVLNVLRSLIENKGTTLYIPWEYKKGVASAVGDPRVHFFPVEAGKRIQIVDISSNQKRFNFSLKGLVPVLVEFNDNGKTKLVPKKVWRQYNVIRDGKLMFDYVVAKLSYEAFLDLREAGILYYNGVQVPDNHEYNDEFIYKVMLKDLPLISLNWAQPVNIGLYEMMREEVEISQKIKRIKAELKHFVFASYNEYEDEIYREQAPKGEATRVYSGESYSAPCVVYSLPEIVGEDLVGDDYVRQFNDDYNALVKEMRSLNERIGDIRFMSRSVIYAIESSKKQGSYNWSELMPVPRSKNKFRQEAMVETKNGTVKLRREIFEEVIKL